LEITDIYIYIYIYIYFAELEIIYRNRTSGLISTRGCTEHLDCTWEPDFFFRKCDTIYRGPSSCV